MISVKQKSHLIQSLEWMTLEYSESATLPSIYHFTTSSFNLFCGITLLYEFQVKSQVINIKRRKKRNMKLSSFIKSRLKTNCQIDGLPLYKSQWHTNKPKTVIIIRGRSHITCVPKLPIDSMLHSTGFGYLMESHLILNLLLFLLIYFRSGIWAQFIMSNYVQVNQEEITSLYTYNLASYVLMSLLRIAPLRFKCCYWLL